MAPGLSYQDYEFRSNANLGPRPTHSLPKGGSWSVYAETTINAPAKYPYEAILDIRFWREWNTLNPDVIVTKHSTPHAKNLRMEQGAFMTFTLQFAPNKRIRTKEVCRADGHGCNGGSGKVTRIRWTSDNANYLTPAFVMKTERVNEIEPRDDDTTVYRTWISFGGLAASQWKRKYGADFQQKVVDFCRDLKHRSEKLYAEARAVDKAPDGSLEQRNAGCEKGFGSG